MSVEKQSIPDTGYLLKKIYDLQNAVAILVSHPSGHILEDENGELPQRRILKLLGLGQRITDDALNDTTIVEIQSPSIIGQVVMSESGAAFSFVTADGKIADSSNTLHIGRVCGCAIDEPEAGFPVDCIYYGEITNPAWSFTPGEQLFLNGTSISNTPPIIGFTQPIGSVKSPTTILINIEEPVLL